MGTGELEPLAEEINRLTVERREIEAKLAAINESDKIITLHPAALKRYSRDLEKLASMLPRPEIGIGHELNEALQRLISAVIVHAPQNSETLEIEIRGRLEELLETPTFMPRSGGGGQMVAREGVGQNSRQISPGIIELGTWRKSLVDAMMAHAGTGGSPYPTPFS